MAVNTAALKTFAPAMRRQLIEAVGRKLDLLLNSQTPDTLSTYAKQIAELREEQEKSREQLLERVAYTWFNRLCALRYLDAKGWHPFGCKVLMPADDSETQPELLKLMRSGSLPEDLKTFTNEQRLNQLLDGQIPTAIPGGDAQGEVYRELVLAACRSYHQLLPDLFEGLDDASELLLPDDLLTEGSIAGSFRCSISDSDCDDVEIIGWLYQFYISEKKDEVIGKVVKSEDIPAATQLFTPNWIVKYMVQNTIGAQWLATYPDSPLREQMEFYIEPAEQTDEVNAKLAEITPKSLNPEELTLMDPACGSGHILVEAYEIFKAIYLEQGYQLREIPKLIFEKNLFGLDIDQRAAQLSSFCLLMRGRSDDRRLFDRAIKLNVMALKESTALNVDFIARQFDLDAYTLEPNTLTELKQLFENASTLGSLIKVPETIKSQLLALSQLSKVAAQELLPKQELEMLSNLVRQAEFLSKTFDAVVANPPYMGSSGMNHTIKKFAKHLYKNTKADLFACFVDRSCSLTKNNGFSAMVTMHSWMFLSSFENMRVQLLREMTIKTMAHFGPRAFGSISGEIVQTTAFALQKSNSRRYKPSFFQLLHGGEHEKKNSLINNQYRFDKIHQDEFSNVPGSPLAYWLTPRVRAIFAESSTVKEVADLKQGLATCNNELFLRSWWEIDTKSSAIWAEWNEDLRAKKWFSFIKGGPNRKWYGNFELLVNWQNDGYDIHVYNNIPQTFFAAPVRAKQYYFREGINWSSIASGGFAVRYTPSGSIFGTGGSSGFCRQSTNIFCLLGLLNSKLSAYLLPALSPTLNREVGQVGSLPFDENRLEKIQGPLAEISRACIDMAMRDWNDYENSWSFQSLPLLSSNQNKNLFARYESWIFRNKEIIEEMKRLEEANNKLIIEAFDLLDEITPEVSLAQITLTMNPDYRYGSDCTEEQNWKRFQQDSIAELLSYAVGCMMGRYSLDHPGLILADSRTNQDEQLAAYESKTGKSINDVQFKPDADAIIPVLDGEWFEDDIVARTREFLKVTFPESSVAENLRFIEESIGKDIRKYFCKDFYKDHLQTYKKRPIYWMVQSPKAGFACLIYLHRYTPDTLLQVLNNYFRPYLQKLEARQEHLERDQNNDALPKREQTAARKEAEKITKVIKECQAWEQDALLPLAQQRIELDLDDGVKVNYLKLKDVLQKIPGLAAKGD